MTQKHMNKSVFCQNNLSKSPNSYVHSLLWASVVHIINFSAQTLNPNPNLVILHIWRALLPQQHKQKFILNICFITFIHFLWLHALFVGSLAPQQAFNLASRCFIVKKVCFITCKVKTEGRVTLLLQICMLIDHNGSLFLALPVKKSLLRCPTIFHVLCVLHSVRALRGFCPYESISTNPRFASTRQKPPNLPQMWKKQTKRKRAPESKLCRDSYYCERYCRRAVVCSIQIDAFLIIEVCQHGLACRYRRHFPPAASLSAVWGCWGYSCSVAARWTMHANRGVHVVLSFFTHRED